ncbi:hypothetical protein BKA66DRAFT_476761 [Pyrenochaeta sp. MPI-SDFR-AT-0127]|nr:hypothetical protein BKA66DRAFT_476761 [Pyrenochaeta sp. MPI-SDFR-AT-0127]
MCLSLRSTLTPAQLTEVVPQAARTSELNPTHNGSVPLLYASYAPLSFQLLPCSEFKRIAPKWIIIDRKDLPNDPEYPEYVYDPRPPNATNSPISRHEFSMHLNACEHPCRWSFLLECVPQLDTLSAIAGIPKKRNTFDTTSTNPMDVYAWGLEAKHLILAAYVVIYHFVIFLLPFGFLGWWISKHPDNLQGASVPVTVILGLLSLFWISSGILTQHGT